MVDYNPSGLLERLTSNLPAAFSKSDKTGYSVQLVVQATTGDTSAPQDIAMQGVPRGDKVLLTNAEELAHAVSYWNSEIDRIDVQNLTNKVTILAKMSNTGELVDINCLQH